MKLLEPVAGIKTAQGHALFHFVFFCMCWTVNTDFCHKLPAPAVHGAANNAQVDLDEDFMTSFNANAGHANHGIEDSHEEFLAKECSTFTMIRWSHFTTFILQAIYIFLKLKEFYNLSQFIQAVLVPFSYFMGIFYTIFVVKLHKHTWTNLKDEAPETMELRSWLILEVFLFFCWIFASIFFLAFAYCLKLKSIAKNEIVLESDDNVWNDKGTDDFLRYLKFEYFMFNFCWCKLFMECSIGYIRVHFDDLKEFGPVHFYPEVWIIMILNLNTIMQASVLTNMVNKAEESSARMADSAHKIVGGGKPCVLIIQVVIWMACFGSVIWLYFWHDQFENGNTIIRQWIQIELLIFVLEMPFQMIQYKLMMMKNEINKQKFLAQFSKGMQAELEIKIQDALAKAIKGKMILKPKTDDGDEDKVELKPLNDSSDIRMDEKKYMKKVEELQEIVEKKDELLFKHDFFSLTVFSFLKKNSDLPGQNGCSPIGHGKHGGGWGLKKEKQAQMLYSNVVIGLMVITMVGCMLYQLITSAKKERQFIGDFNLFLVKFPCCIALHFVLCPEVAKGMELMKFANNHPDEFVQYGSEISYMIGFVQGSIALIAEIICVALLVNQPKVDECIIYFISLKVLIEVSAFYFESLMHVKCVQIAHSPPEITNFQTNKDGEVGIKFAERSTFHKIARVLFKILRGGFVSIFYYYYPFFVFFGEWQLPIMSHNAAAGIGGGH